MIADVDAIADPTWRGETLVVHVAGSRNHQPYRVGIVLGALAVDTRLEPILLATFENAQDPIDGPRLPQVMAPSAKKH